MSMNGYIWIFEILFFFLKKIYILYIANNIFQNLSFHPVMIFLSIFVVYEWGYFFCQSMMMTMMIVPSRDIDSNYLWIIRWYYCNFWHLFQWKMHWHYRHILLLLQNWLKSKWIFKLPKKRTKSLPWYITARLSARSDLLPTIQIKHFSNRYVRNSRIHDWTESNDD